MKINNKDKTFIENACHFLGPKGEQREFITKMLELAFNDHIYWRRNFFPKDPPLIPYSYLRSDEFNQYTEKFTQEFFLLLGELKTSVPNFSPRYMCHMNSDPSLAAMISYLAAIFYNANNVTPEASPVTLKLEMMAILDLIEMFYFPREQSFGHLCSGGTVANYHSIYYHRIFKFLPLTVILLAEKFQLITKKTILKKSIIDYLYFSFEETTQFISEVKKLFENKFKDKKSFDEELNQFNFLKLGERKFTSQVSEYFNSEFPELVILCPTSAHYSWKKACGILGLGQDQLISLPLQADYSTCPTQFEKIVIELKQKNIAILQTVFISGTTELGIFDNLSELMKKVNKLRKNKIHFPVHVDGAYGGYYQSINIIEKNGLFNKAKTIPIYSKTCAQRMKGIELVDSITIDPHKLGFAPYGAGAFITRHGHLKKYLSEKAEYIFSEKSQQQLKSSSNEKNKTSPQFLDWNFPLGKYILEGSKSGAMATSVYFSHKMMPLEQNGLGSYLNQLNKVAFEFQK